MIDPPQVRPEEPTAVTPHGGICGGESQQWLSYPTNPHVRFDERDVEPGAMVGPLRHRQTKEAETDMPGLPPPRHIPTLPIADFQILSQALSMVYPPCTFARAGVLDRGRAREQCVSAA